MLDYGFRSKCCGATIRISHKKIKNSSIKKKIWVCNKCGSRDINIIPKTDLPNQESLDTGNSPW